MPLSADPRERHRQITEVLQRQYRGAQWTLRGGDHENMTWVDLEEGRERPTIEQIEAAWDNTVAAQVQADEQRRTQAEQFLDMQPDIMLRAIEQLTLSVHQVASSLQAVINTLPEASRPALNRTALDNLIARLRQIRSNV